MVDYTKSEARAWARENFGGTVAVTHPSFTPDFSGINENAIRHDILKLKELGFEGSLLVAEANVTPEENARITAVAREAAGPDFALFFHAIFGTLEENIHAANLATKAGADRALLAYPTSFWPTSFDEVFDYTKRSPTRPTSPRCCSRFRHGASSGSTPPACRWSSCAACLTRSRASWPSRPSRATRASPG